MEAFIIKRAGLKNEILNKFLYLFIFFHPTYIFFDICTPLNIIYFNATYAYDTFKQCSLYFN